MDTCTTVFEEDWRILLTCERDRRQYLVCESQSARLVVRVQLHFYDGEWHLLVL
jgi:hypothetical protein